MIAMLGNGSRNWTSLNGQSHTTKQAARNYFSEGMQLLELIKILPELLERQPPREKRELLKFVISNSAWKEGTLTVIDRQPFDLFIIWRATMNKEPVPKEMKNGLNEEWLLR
jgi:site-specific DNA recombinase